VSSVPDREWTNSSSPGRWQQAVEKRSPLRREKTHVANLNALKFLRPVFGATRLPEIAIESIEDYIEQRLRSERSRA